MFTLKNHGVIFAGMNVRPESHGEDITVVVDCKIKTRVSSETLSELHPSLASFLFQHDPKKMDLADEPDKLNVVRFPFLGSVAWTKEKSPVPVEFALIPEKPTVQADCRIHKIQIAPMIGGYSGLNFTVTIAPDGKQVGALSGMLGETILLTINQPPEE